MNYDKTWTVMNNLEEAFNKISSIEFMVDELIEAVNRDDITHINNIANAMSAFLPVFIDNYDRASKRAWKNTVTEVAKTDNPYKSLKKKDSFSYQDVVKYLETDPYGNYVSKSQKEETES